MEHRAWEIQKAWADQFEDEVRRVVRSVAGHIVEIVPSDPVRDMEQAVDYEVRVAAGDISCRIRRAERCSYRDLTMTTRRKSGAIPEADKILEGSVRWYLYAWANGREFVEWMFVDLDVVREKKLIERARARGSRRSPDGSRFISISHEELASAGAIVASTVPVSVKWVAS
jgi:hypothetical protein